jgi:glutaredoxin-related protein
MKNVILYSSNCSKCKVLEAKLNQKNIDFSIKNSEEDFQSLFDEGFREMPVLEVENNKYTFGEAVQLINNYAE